MTLESRVTTFVLFTSLAAALLASAGVSRPEEPGMGQDTLPLGGFGSDDGELGFMVTSVVPDGPLARSGVERGDRIAGVERRQVAGVRDYVTQVSQLDRTEIRLIVVRDSVAVEVMVIPDTTIPGFSDARVAPRGCAVFCQRVGADVWQECGCATVTRKVCNGCASRFLN